jgi:hypothetical protein
VSVRAKETPAYLRAKSLVPADLQRIFDELLDDYRFAALKHHGREWVAPKVIAELVLMGWRNVPPAGDARERLTSPLCDDNNS